MSSRRPLLALLIFWPTFAIGPSLCAHAAPWSGEVQATATAPAATKDKTAANIERMLTFARTGSPVIRPQAAKRLLALGAPAAERLWKECGEDVSGCAALGPELVAIMASFGDERLRSLTWRALSDADFPWRPAAANSLAQSASAAGGVSEGTAFLALLDDPIVQVRRAAIEGLAKLGRRENARALSACLQDERGEVRRVAASTLAEWGQPSALWTLVDELQRADRFFSIPIGRSARHEAWKLLAPRLGAELAFDPELDPDQNLPALRAITAAVSAVAGDRSQDSERSSASEAGSSSAFERKLGLPSDAQVVLGLELRSCRRGEFFLRWTKADELWVGLGWPTRVVLAPGTVAKLEALAEQRLAALGPERFWGTPGCDIERLHLPRVEGRTEVLLISKGPDAVEGLRPDPLSVLVNALLATLPNEAIALIAAESDATDAASVPRSTNASRLTQLRDRIRAALTVIGGDPQQVSDR
ncbi:MAG: hypothetical protein ACI835_002642 [Planctomycetota bacterium]|jgi:hypothetical protein